MAQVKLEEEQELWEPAEVDYSVSFKEEPEYREIQSFEDISSVVHCKKEEPEEVEINAEPFPQFLLVSVKSEEGEPQSSLLHQTITEENREDTGSSDTEDSEDWAPSAERPAPQTQSELNELHGPAHSNNVSEETQARSRTCPDCGKTYRNVTILKIHQRSHTGERPFRCTVCKKCFITKGHLNEHIRTHTGEKTFECSVCQKDFIAKRSLKQHMRSHTGERPFRCTVCEKDFTKRGNLNVHMRIHTGERPFRCTTCEKCFKTKSNLNNHMRFHTGEKPFKCTVCERGFTQNIGLKKHMRTHTSETEKLLTFVLGTSWSLPSDLGV